MNQQQQDNNIPADKRAIRVIFRLSFLILYGMASGIIVSIAAAPAVLGMGNPVYYGLGAVFCFCWLFLIGVRKVISGSLLIFLHQQFAAIDADLEGQIREEARTLLQKKFRQDLMKEIPQWRNEPHN